MKTPAWLFILVLLGLVQTQGLQAAGGQAAAARRAPRFVDQDGDGFNDLAPDVDHDGIPDCVDPDQTQLKVAVPARGRGHHGRAWMMQAPAPDSLAGDSVRFRGWWETRGRHGWGPAGQQGLNGSPGWGCPWDPDPLAPCPRGGRFLNDPTARPGSGGGNGGGNGNGGGGGRGRGGN